MPCWRLSTVDYLIASAVQKLADVAQIRVRTNSSKMRCVATNEYTWSTARWEYVFFRVKNKQLVQLQRPLQGKHFPTKRWKVQKRSEKLFRAVSSVMIFHQNRFPSLWLKQKKQRNILGDSIWEIIWEPTFFGRKRLQRKKHTLFGEMACISFSSKPFKDFSDAKNVLCFCGWRKTIWETIGVTKDQMRKNAKSAKMLKLRRTTFCLWMLRVEWSRYLSMTTAGKKHKVTNFRSDVFLNPSDETLKNEIWSKFYQ